MMAKFVFKLEGVRRERKNTEQQRQREAAVIQGQMNQLQDELQSLNDTVRAADEDMRQNRLVGKVDLNFLFAHRRFSLAMQRKAVGIAQQMNGLRIKLLEAQRRLAEAVKRRKVIEKLREKYWERWREEVARNELHELDEVAMQMSRQQLLEDEQAGVA